VLAGFAVTVLPVVDDKPVPGDQLYVVAPLAVKTTLLPGHIDGDDGVTLIVGFELTVTVTLVAPVQPLASVPVTV